MLAADVHLGTKNCDFQMERYVFKRRTDGNDNNTNESPFLFLFWKKDVIFVVVYGIICMYDCLVDWNGSFSWIQTVLELGT